MPQSRLHKFSTAHPKENPICVVCQTSVRSKGAADQLRSMAYPHVFAIEGGIQAWKDAGYKTKRVKGPIPIMRQVQIVAGSMAFIGGLFTDLRWIAIIVGAGLVFAGISGTCGMARVLAWMPWNRKKKSPSSGDVSCGKGGPDTPCSKSG